MLTEFLHCKPYVDGILTHVDGINSVSYGYHDILSEACIFNVLININDWVLFEAYGFRTIRGF